MPIGKKKKSKQNLQKITVLGGLFDSFQYTKYKFTKFNQFMFI